MQVWRALLRRRPMSTGHKEETFAEVLLIAHGYRLAVAAWSSRGRAAVEAVIGGPFSVPVA